MIYKTWADKTAKEYKQYKGLKKENLRDNMTNKELVMNMLAKRGGGVAKEARLKLELETGKPVVSRQSAKQLLPSAKGKKDD